MATATGAPGPDDWSDLATRLGSGIAEVIPARWGDTRAVTRVRLADGRDLAARRLVGPAAGDEADRLVRAAAHLQTAGIHVAWPVDRYPAADGGWVVTPWVPGPLGAASLGDPAGRRVLAASMGRLAARLSAVEIGALELDRTWAEPSLVADRATAALQTLSEGLGDPASGLIAADIEHVTSAWTGAGAWSVGLAHGDLAPVNVVVEDDGELVLLDLGGLRVGPRILDIAWWGWILRFHHPEVWAATWELFLDSAGIAPATDIGALAPSLARLLLLERAIDATGDDDRARWLDRLRTTASW